MQQRERQTMQGFHQRHRREPGRDGRDAPADHARAGSERGRAGRPKPLQQPWTHHDEDNNFGQNPLRPQEPRSPRSNAPVRPAQHFKAIVQRVTAYDESCQRHERQEAGRRQQGADIRPLRRRGLVQRISRELKRRHGGEREQRAVHPDNAIEARRLDHLTSAYGAHDKGRRRPTAHPSILEPAWR
jgi:hypothetical protein